MTIHIDTPPNFDVPECINAHGWRQLAPFSWDADTQTLERVEELGTGNVALLTIRAGDGGRTVEVDVTGGDAAEHGVVRRVRHMLQLDLPLDRFHDYCSGRPELSHVPALRQGRMLRSPSLFEDTSKVVATTNTTWSQTKSMVRRIVDSFGSPLPTDPTRLAFPRPDQIASVTLEEFSAKARLGYRNASVHCLARDVAEGRLDLESWDDPAIPSNDLYKRLLSLPGVGPYAAACLMIYLGRYDRVNVDSWARMMVGKELGRTVTDKEARDFFEPYGEWKALVYHFYKWRESPPDY
jgi:3-methyladenine DNA glycosylase/8-oxoguanine DNA glycosylase